MGLVFNVCYSHIIAREHHNSTSEHQMPMCIPIRRDFRTGGGAKLSWGATGLGSSPEGATLAACPAPPPLAVGGLGAGGRPMGFGLGKSGDKSYQYDYPLLYFSWRAAVISHLSSVRCRTLNKRCCLTWPNEVLLTRGWGGALDRGERSRELFTDR